MTARKPYKTERSLSDFFKANPNEELTIEDAALKFGVTEKTAAVYLSMLSSDKVVERVSVYRLRKPQ